MAVPVLAGVLPALAKAGGKVAANVLGGFLPVIGREVAVAFSPVARAHRKMLRTDMEKLRTGVGLGLSEAEKRKMAQEAIRAAQAAQSTLLDQARRTGDYRNIAKLSAASAMAGAMSRDQAEKLSAQLAEARAADIRNRMAQRYSEVTGVGEATGASVANAISRANTTSQGADVDQLAALVKQLEAAGGAAAGVGG